MTYDKVAATVQDLTEERCRWTRKKLKDFLSLKISVEEGVESREEEEVSRDHEEEEEGKKARAKLCTVLSGDLECGRCGWEGRKTRNR